MPNATSARSIPEILSDILNQFTALFRKEMELARTELAEKLSQTSMALGLIGAGAVLLIPAITILLWAGVTAITDAGLSAIWAFLIVGGGAFLIGIIVALVGINRLKTRNLIPDKTIHQLQEDASVAKQQMRQDHDYQRAA